MEVQPTTTGELTNSELAEQVTKTGNGIDRILRPTYMVFGLTFKVGVPSLDGRGNYSYETSIHNGVMYSELSYIRGNTGLSVQKTGYTTNNDEEVVIMQDTNAGRTQLCLNYSADDNKWTLQQGNASPEEALKILDETIELVKTATPKLRKGIWAVGKYHADYMDLKVRRSQSRVAGPVSVYDWKYHLPFGMRFIDRDSDFENSYSGAKSYYK